MVSSAVHNKKILLVFAGDNVSVEQLQSVTNALLELGEDGALATTDSGSDL